MARIYLSVPHMGGKELPLIEEAFDSNFIAPTGPMLPRFENLFTTYTGIPYAAAVNSCTGALHLAMRVLDIKPGDRVYCTDLTFIGGTAPVLYQYATPVFIDSDHTWTMDPALLAEALKEDVKTGALPKAVIATDLYGQSCDLDAILAVCKPYNIPVVVDSAEALGSRYKNRHCGEGAVLAAFSFSGNKIITTSGGGILASNDAALIERARFLAYQARDEGVHYQHSTYGYNYRMSNISAAIGCGQMEVLPDRVRRRREIFAYYEKALGDLPGIAFMAEASYGKSNRWLTTLTIDPKLFGASREDVRLALDKADIEARPVWKPMHLQPVFKDCRVIGGDVSRTLFDQGLCLPSSTQITDSEQNRVIDVIRSFVKD